ncbi:MAG TPA: GspE/PulE family protein [Candidatus Omnitrophota bacterium]|nr:GspE/PulE family protein [Candidatus Omnitrophota bacterium]
MMQTKQNLRRYREVVNLLLKEGLITEKMLEYARQEAQMSGLNIEKALIKLELVTEEDIVKVRANVLGIPYMDLSDYIIDPEIIAMVPKEVCLKFSLVPLFKIGNNITVGMVDPQDIVALDQLRRICTIDNVDPVLVSERGVRRLLDSSFGIGSSIDDIVKSIDNEEAQEAVTEIGAGAPLVRLVNIVIAQAVKDHASDIHIEPEEDGVRIRLREDGVLQELKMLPKKIQSGIISRVKIMAKMDIAESRKPQDGRIRIKIENKELDLRVSSFPTIHGENIVLRVLDKSAVLLGLKELGFLDDELQAFQKLINRPYGIVLVTGPTGSGKTSTLYSALTQINSVEKKIVTIEDPVEYELSLIRQTQINPKAGLTFATGLRSILRQDPDIIMVGEIRDRETADIAIQAALTGHLVFATLHTNDAPSTISRLLDMGIEPFLLSTSLIGILAQRLVRTICYKCKDKVEVSGALSSDFNLEGLKHIYRGKGCRECDGTGLKGRTGIFELLLITEEIRRNIETRTSADEIRKIARKAGFKTLRDSGVQLIRNGVTTPEEVLRVTMTE